MAIAADVVRSWRQASIGLALLLGMLFSTGLALAALSGNGVDVQTGLVQVAQLRAEREGSVRSQMVRPLDCELSWKAVPNPGPNGLYDTLNDLEAISADNIWAVGGYQDNTPYRTLIQHWDGIVWSVVPSPNSGTGDNYLYDISAVSANDIWAVGYYRDGGMAPYYQLILHWDGSSWSTTSTPFTEGILYGITAISASDVWAVGTADGTLTLQWDGSAWSRVTSPNRGDNWNRLYSISASGPNDVWAVGNYRNSGQPEQTLAMHWDGAAWAIVSSPNPTSGRNLLFGVTVVSPSDVWAVGHANSSTSIWATLILHWDGSAWAQVASPSPGTYSNNILQDVDAISANDIWAVGSYDSSSGSYTLAEHWDGSAWSVVDSPNPGPYPMYYNYFFGVTALASDNVWAVGETLIEHYSTDCPIPTPTPVTPTATVPPTATTPPTATPTPCTPGSFSDVPPDNTFYPFVTCLVNRNIISGYGDCTFRPNNLITRSQIAKIVSNAADFQEDPGVQIFEDTPPSDPFYQWINRLARRGHMSGYPCGGEGEPCGVGNLPYFRPYANATRSQLAKIVSNAAGFIDEPTGQIFADVPQNHPFYLWVQRLASRQIMGGYACGSEGEPCGSENRPYFRPYNAVTRGQSSKIVAGAFFPNCQNLIRR